MASTSGSIKTKTITHDPQRTYTFSWKRTSTTNNSSTISWTVTADTPGGSGTWVWEYGGFVALNGKEIWRGGEYGKRKAGKVASGTFTVKQSNGAATSFSIGMSFRIYQGTSVNCSGSWTLPALYTDIGKPSKILMSANTARGKDYTTANKILVYNAGNIALKWTAAKGGTNSKIDGYEIFIAKGSSSSVAIAKTDNTTLWNTNTSTSRTGISLNSLVAKDGKTIYSATTKDTGKYIRFGVRAYSKQTAIHPKLVSSIVYSPWIKIAATPTVPIYKLTCDGIAIDSKTVPSTYNTKNIKLSQISSTNADGRTITYYNSKKEKIEQNDIVFKLGSGENKFSCYAQVMDTGDNIIKSENSSITTIIVNTIPVVSISSSQNFFIYNKDNTYVNQSSIKFINSDNKTITITPILYYAIGDSPPSKWLNNINLTSFKITKQTLNKVYNFNELAKSIIKIGQEYWWKIDFQIKDTYETGQTQTVGNFHFSSVLKLSQIRDKKHSITNIAPTVTVNNVIYTKYFYNELYISYIKNTNFNLSSVNFNVDSVSLKGIIENLSEWTQNNTVYQEVKITIPTPNKIGILNASCKITLTFNSIGTQYYTLSLSTTQCKEVVPFPIENFRYGLNTINFFNNGQLNNFTFTAEPKIEGIKRGDQFFLQDNQIITRETITYLCPVIKIYSNYSTNQQEISPSKKTTWEFQKEGELRNSQVFSSSDVFTYNVMQNIGLSNYLFDTQQTYIIASFQNQYGVTYTSKPFSLKFNFNIEPKFVGDLKLDYRIHSSDPTQEWQNFLGEVNFIEEGCQLQTTLEIDYKTSTTYNFEIYYYNNNIKQIITSSAQKLNYNSENNKKKIILSWGTVPEINQNFPEEIKVYVSVKTGFMIQPLIQSYKYTIGEKTYETFKLLKHYCPSQFKIKNIELISNQLKISCVFSELILKEESTNTEVIQNTNANKIEWINGTKKYEMKFKDGKKIYQKDIVVSFPVSPQPNYPINIQGIYSTKVANSKAYNEIIKKTYSNIFIFYENQPTVSYRANQVGINYKPDIKETTQKQYKDGVLIVQRYNSGDLQIKRNKIYLLYNTTTTTAAREINLDDGKIVEFWIDGGELK